MRDDSALYFNLAPEFGTQRLGPFQQLEIRCGSDNARCHVFIPDSFGVAKEHCKILRQTDGSMILSPVDRTAAVYVWKGDARRPTQVLTPTALRSGDAFSLVTPDGPKFFVEVGTLPKANPAGGINSMFNANKKRFTIAGFLAEIRRVAMATLYTFSPIAMLARVKLAIESGVIFTPRFIISAMMLLSGWIMAAPASCSAIRSSSMLAEAQEAKKECDEKLGFSDGSGGDTMKLTPLQLIGKLLSTDIAVALGKDSDISNAVKEKAKGMLAESDSYSWLFSDSSTVKTFTSWRERAEKTEGLDPATRKLVPYLAATPNRIRPTRSDLDYARILDSANGYACARGPIRLTWRQGKSLGMDAVLLDAHVADNTSVAEDESQRFALLNATAASAKNPLLVPDPTVTLASDVANLSQGNEVCVYQTGDDDREDPSKVMKMLVAQIGASGSNLPEASANHSAVARIARIFAADLPMTHFGKGTGIELNFKKAPLSNDLEEVPGGDWVLKQTAEVIARSVVLPCLATLRPAEEKAALANVFGKLPDPLTCLILNYRLQNEGG